MRFNHMELTFPIGSLTGDVREEIDAFYGSVFGWTALDTEVTTATQTIKRNNHPRMVTNPLGRREWKPKSSASARVRTTARAAHPRGHYARLVILRETA